MVQTNALTGSRQSADRTGRVRRHRAAAKKGVRSDDDAEQQQQQARQRGGENAKELVSSVGGGQ